MSARHHTGPRHRRFHRDLSRRQRHQSDSSAVERTVRSLRTASVLSPRRLVKGLVVIARIPFVDRPDYKLRPALVVGTNGREVTLRPISTSERLVALRGGDRVELNGRRCWILDYIVAVDIADVVAIDDRVAA